MKYAQQLRIDGSAAPIIPGLTGVQVSLFDLAEPLPDLTYAGTVVQPALAIDNDAQICSACPAYVHAVHAGTRCEYWNKHDDNRPLCARYHYPRS